MINNTQTLLNAGSACECRRTLETFILNGLLPTDLTRGKFREGVIGAFIRIYFRYFDLSAASESGA